MFVGSTYVFVLFFLLMYFFQEQLTQGIVPVSNPPLLRGQHNKVNPIPHPRPAPTHSTTDQVNWLLNWSVVLSLVPRGASTELAPSLTPPQSKQTLDNLSHGFSFLPPTTPTIPPGGGDPSHRPSPTPHRRPRRTKEKKAAGPERICCRTVQNSFVRWSCTSYIFLSYFILCQYQRIFPNSHSVCVCVLISYISESECVWTRLLI